jgi:hypothetical protein
MSHKVSDRREHYDRSTDHGSEKVSQISLFGSWPSEQLPLQGRARS